MTPTNRIRTLLREEKIGDSVEHKKFFAKEQIFYQSQELKQDPRKSLEIVEKTVQ